MAQRIPAALTSSPMRKGAAVQCVRLAWHRCLIFLFAMLMMPTSCAFAAAKESGYNGIEFFGSSLISRVELEKELGLKPGASSQATVKAAERLKSRLQKKGMQSCVAVISDGDNCYVVVDVLEPGVTGVPLRKLPAPHHVYFTSDLPFRLLEQMFARIDELAQQGRSPGEEVVDGIKQFSDEPCNQFAKKLLQVVPVMRQELLEAVQNDPDPVRRSKAIECLNWDTHPARDCLALAPIIDDGAEEVRASTARYIYPRLKLLPDNFPIEGLIEGFSHELSRPSHVDRSLALRCLTEIVRTHPFSATAVKNAVGDKAQQLAQQSLLSSIKQPAQQLLELCSHPPQLPKPRVPAQLNEF